MNKMKTIVKQITRSDLSSLILIMIVIVAFFTAMNSNYFSLRNLINILFSASTVGIVAVALSYLIISGGVDLSPGAIAAFSGVLVALLIKNGLQPLLAAIICLMVAAIIGFINSLLINYLKIEAFIVTLAGMSIYTGLAFILGNGRSIGILNKGFNYFGGGSLLGIPLSIYVFAVIFIIFLIILNRTRFGRMLYMIGGNEAAARLAGINPVRIRTILYMFTPVMGCLAGLIMAGRMNSGQPTALAGLAFAGITAGVVGGVRFGGGRGTLVGMLVGLLLIEAFNNGIAVLGVRSFWQQVASGLLLVVALVVDYFRNKRSLLQQ